MDLKTETHDGDIYHFGSYFFTVLAKFKVFNQAFAECESGVSKANLRHKQLSRRTSDEKQ